MPIWSPMHWDYDDENKEWIAPERIEKFVDWYSQPRLTRNPTSMKQWAEQEGWHYKTVLRWPKDPRVKAMLQERRQSLIAEPGDVTEVLEALQKRAAGGDVQAIKLYLEFIGEFTETKRVETQSAAEFTDEQLREAAAAFAQDA